MDFASILKYLAPFEPLLKPELLQLDAQAVAELQALVSGISSPDLKALAQALLVAVETFSQAEINNLA